MRRATAAVLVLALGALAATAPAAKSPRGPRMAGCPMFPKSFATNKRVDRLPVAASSDAMIASIGAEETVHPDFGAGAWEGRPIGIPYDVVGDDTPRTAVAFEYAAESDNVRYPIPPDVRIEGGGDRHALLLDRDRCWLYELFALERSGDGWEAGSGAVWRLRSKRLRPRGWTSADAAGLPILPLLARYPEVRRGSIRHALRMTVRHTRRAFVHPARHFASDSTDPNLPRMGERLRLKRSVKVGDFPRQARPIVRAMRRYGLIVADNGSDWYVSGAPDARWDDAQLRSLANLRGSDFEVVDTSRLRRRR